MISLDAYGKNDAFGFGSDDNVDPEANTPKVDPRSKGQANSGGPDLRADDMVVKYFEDVRQHALLSRAEEKALWGKIESYKGRLHRALYMSPVALDTLRRMWRQADAGDIPLHHMITQDETGARATSDLMGQLEAAILSLENLQTAIETLRTWLRSSAWSGSERRVLRAQWCRLWQQWLSQWDALNLQSSLHEALEFALQAAHQDQPEQPALRASYTAWIRSRRQLTHVEEQMLQSNLRLVIHVANRYRDRGVPLLDLIQEGNIGLMRALEKFEPRRGLKFITYAHWWVRQAISRSLMEQNRTVRLPVYVVERKHKLQSISDRLWEETGREPSVDELSEAIGWTTQEVTDTQSVGQPMVHLHTPIAEDGRVLSDILEDTDTPPLEAWHAEQELHDCLTDSLAHLTEREAFVLRLRYGLNDHHPHTLQEIADHLGLSRERARQVQNKALEKLRQSHGYEVLADFAGNLN
jgi:RNA polymerase sigma factor (sigma-70 family)